MNFGSLPIRPVSDSCLKIGQHFQVDSSSQQPRVCIIEVFLQYFFMTYWDSLINYDLPSEDYPLVGGASVAIPTHFPCWHKCRGKRHISLDWREKMYHLKSWNLFDERSDFMIFQPISWRLMVLALLPPMEGCSSYNSCDSIQPFYGTFSFFYVDLSTPI